MTDTTGLTSAARTIPTAFHNLNNAANFLMLISNADDVRPELRDLALAYSLALTTVHSTVGDLREIVSAVATHEGRYPIESEDACLYCGTHTDPLFTGLEDNTLHHAPDCPVTAARAYLAQEEARS